MPSHAIAVDRLPGLSYINAKDPSLVLNNRTCCIYLSIGGITDDGWRIGRYESITGHPAGPYRELPPVELYGVNGGQICAPAVIQDKRGAYHLYVQEYCFAAHGDIAHAMSNDGRHFYATDPAMTVTRMREAGFAVGALYDAGVSRHDDENGDEIEVLTFSGYRETDGVCHVGCGDLYKATRNVSRGETIFGTPTLVIRQEDVQFHNRPGGLFWEWGLEAYQEHRYTYNGRRLPNGRKPRPIDFALATCFLPRSGPDASGTRQRVCIMAKYAEEETYTSIGVLLDTPHGENGHADLQIEDGGMHVVFQQREQMLDAQGRVRRAADNGIYMTPWHLRYALFDANKMYLNAVEQLDRPAAKRGLQTYLPLAYTVEKPYLSRKAAVQRLMAA